MIHEELAMLEAASMGALIDAYTLIAGIGNGYKNALTTKSDLTQDQIQERFLKLDRRARNAVGEALSLYLDQKKDGDES